MGGNVKKANEQRNQRTSIFLPIDPLKMAKINTTRFSCTGLPGWISSVSVLLQRVVFS